MLTLKEISDYMENVNDWSLEGEMIVRDFLFANFIEAIDFVNKVGMIAEKHSHHPDIMITYNRVRISLTTHSVKGLTKTDFDMAEEIEKIFSGAAT